MILSERQFNARVAEITADLVAVIDAQKIQNQTLADTVEQLIKSSETLQKSAFLIGIERIERKVIFTFSVAGKLETVETIGTWADNVADWKAKLNVR